MPSHPMRRHDRQITDPAEIEAVIMQAEVCHLALVDQGRPYVVPLNFGFEGGKLYFHSAREGRKLDAIKADGRVSIAFSLPHQIVKADQACQWGFRYSSVIGFGRARLIDDPAAKAAALAAIMAHYDDDGGEYDFSAGIDRVVVVEVEFEELTGKRTG